MEVQLESTAAATPLTIQTLTSRPPSSTSPPLAVQEGQQQQQQQVSDLSGDWPALYRQTCLLIETSALPQRRAKKRRGKKRRRTHSSSLPPAKFTSSASPPPPPSAAAATSPAPPTAAADTIQRKSCSNIKQLTIDIYSAEAASEGGGAATYSSPAAAERLLSECEESADGSGVCQQLTPVPPAPAPAAAGGDEVGGGASASVDRARARLSRRQRRRRSVQQQQLTPPPILRPLHVPHAPLNSTSFLMEQHYPQQQQQQQQQYTPFDGDDDYMDRDFEAVYQAAHMQQLTDLEPRQLSEQLQQLEERERQLQAELLRRDPRVWVQQLQRRLLQLQQHNRLLLKSRSALLHTDTHTAIGCDRERGWEEDCERHTLPCSPPEQVTRGSEAAVSEPEVPESGSREAA